MSIFSKGEDQPDQRELMHEDRMRMQHQTNLGMGANGEITHRETDFLRELLETPVDAPEPNTLESMMSKDFTLANLNKAEMNKLRWDAMYLKKIYKDMHPPGESVMQGEYRAFLLDDREEAWGHLHSSEQLKTDEFLAVYEARLSRGRDGFQQKQNNTSINISEARETQPEEEDDGGWLRR